MNPPLLILVVVIYTWVGLVQFIQVKNPGMGLFFLGCAIANIGLLIEIS